MGITIRPLHLSTSGEMAPRQLSQITDLIIHHSAGSPTQSVIDIDAEHRSRGMAMIGYNYVISGDGTITEGRPLQFVPAAAYGRNTESVNVCVLGNFQSDDAGYTGVPSPAQINSLTELCVYLHHSIPSIIRTIGHRDVAPMFYPKNEGDYSTACPGSVLYDMLGKVKIAVSAAMARV